MKEDITGQKFGLLTAIKPVGKYQRCTIWLCKCDCGNETEVLLPKLKNGHTRSCSCIKVVPKPKFGKEHPQWEGYEEISKSFYTRMQDGAKLREWDWELSIKYLWDLYIKQNRKCNLSGREIKMPIYIKDLRDKNNDDLASLDRINPRYGYIEGNVQWICKRINYMKHVMLEEVFLKYINDIYLHKIENTAKLL